MCGRGRRQPEPPGRQSRLPQLAGPSVRKLKVSYVRAGAGRGGQDRAARSRRARLPPAPAARCGPPGRARRAHRAGFGVVVGEAWAAALRRDPPAPHPDPRPRQAGTGWDRAPALAPDASSRTPFLPPPAPPRTLNFGNPPDPPLDPQFGKLGTRDLYSAPDPEPDLSPLPAGPGPWECVPSVSPRPSPGPGLVPQEVQAHLGWTGQGPGRAGPGAFSPSAALAL